MKRVNSLKGKLRLWSAFLLCAIVLVFFKTTELNAEVEKKESIDSIYAVNDKIYDTWLGIYYATFHAKDRNYVEIAGIFPQGPAEKTALKKRDKIISIADKPVSSIREVQDMIKNFPPGTIIPIQYERDRRRFRTDIRVEKKEDIKDFLGKRLPITSLEDTANGKSLHVTLYDTKIKVIYFWYDNFKPSVRFRDKLVNFLRLSAAKDIQMITLTFIDTDASDKANMPQMPYYRLSEFDEKYSLIFRVHQYPAIIIADQKNIIRFADYVDETTIAKPLAIIEELQRQSINGDRK